MAEVFPAPPAQLKVRWPQSRWAEAGARVPVTVMTSPPARLSWPSARGELYTVSSRARNEPSRRFHNHGEGPYWGLLVGSMF